jgi:general secretion pathway protein F
MPMYVVQVRVKGTVKPIDISANSPEIAKRLAKRYGIVLSVGKKRAGMQAGGLSQSDRYIFLIRLSTMLASKVGAAEALRLLRDSFGGKISNVSAKMLERVEMGMDLPSALVEDPKNFPGAISMIVKAGAATGQTWRALQEAAEFEKEIADVKKGSKGGLISAMGSFFLAGLLLVASTFYIGPKVMEMGLMKENAGKIDMSLANGLSYAGGGFMMVVLVLFSALFWLATVGRRFFPTTADNLIVKIPYYSDIVLSQQNFINLYRLALMVKSGVRMEDALKTAHSSCGKGALKEDFGRALLALKNGQKWASGMMILHPTDRAALMLAADRDQIATNLNNIAAQYNALYKQRIGTFTPTMQLMAALAMSLSGMVMFMQTTMPMLQLSANMMNDN